MRARQLPFHNSKFLIGLPVFLSRAPLFYLYLTILPSHPNTELVLADDPNLKSVDRGVLKQVSAALVTLIVEAAKHNADGANLRYAI